MTTLPAGPQPAPSTRRRRRHAPALGFAAFALSALLIGGTAPAAFAGDAGSAAEAAPAPSPWAGNMPNTAGGTDYFVDASGGSDAATGTSPATAWKSFDKVNATTFSAGDRILLKGGETWSNAQLWPKGSGTEAAPISIDAYGDAAGRRPYIATNGVVPSPFDASGVKNPDTVGLTGAVNLQNQQYWSIANLELSNDDDFATDITTGSYVRDGISVSINADKFAPGADTIMDGIDIHDVFVHDLDGPSTWQKIYYAGVDFQVFGQKQYGEYGTGGHHFKDIRIENNTFKNVELNAVQFGFNWFGDQVGQTDEAGKYHEGWEQLWIRTQDLYSRDVYIGHNYAESIGQGAYQFGDTKNLVAEYNEANGWLQRYSGVSAGLYLWAGADSVMRYNEIYGGPANEFDATPWDLEFTNFNVLYEHNYSHDNQGGWMSYMGNSSNSIARYNLSVNDNGVIFKNMLSTNYSPTYILNNVFVYDGAKLASFHDEVLKDRVYFANNVFYNTSTTATTNWFRKPGALDKAVFSNNAYFEASGIHSPDQPKDENAVQADPQFVGDPADYARTGGVDQVKSSAALFALKETSPLIDAGRYNARIGSTDFFGTELYYGDGVDIGLDETEIGAKVTDPVDTDPIENEGIDTRIDLAKGKPAVASSTHPHNNFEFSAAKLVDGDPATRWAGADDATYPLTIDIDFQKETTFDEVDLAEFTDSGTNKRVRDFDLQRWDAATASWVTFSSKTDGIDADRMIDDFGSITSSKLRLSITALLPGEIYAPTLTTISVYDTTPAVTDPKVTPAAAVIDVNPALAGDARNAPSFTVGLGGDTLTGLRYVTPAGALVGSLGAGDYTRADTASGTVITLTPEFSAGKELGRSGVLFEFGSSKTIRVAVELVDTTGLVEAIDAAKAVPVEDSAGYRALETELTKAEAVLSSANRSNQATGNTAVTQTDVAAAASALEAALAAYVPTAPPTTVPTPTPAPTPTGPAAEPTPGAAPRAAGAGGSGSAGALASTGSDSLGLALGAALLLLTGGAIGLSTLRKRRSRTGSAS